MILQELGKTIMPFKRGDTRDKISLLYLTLLSEFVNLQLSLVQAWSCRLFITSAGIRNRYSCMLILPIRA